MLTSSLKKVGCSADIITFAFQTDRTMMDDDFDIRDARMPESEREYENALRPLSFRDFSGQAKVVVYIINLLIPNIILPDSY